MLTHPDTLYWYRADQSCFVVPTSSWIPCKQEPLPFLKSLVWLDQAPTGNWTHRTTWSVLSPPYCRILRSAGATEDLFITRELHREPPPRTPTEYLDVCLFVCGISLTSGQLISELFPDCTRSCFSQVDFTPQGRWPHLWDEVPICSSGTQCPLYSAASLG